jgi:hypothetical protein
MALDSNALRHCADCQLYVSIKVYNAKCYYVECRCVECRGIFSTKKRKAFCKHLSYNSCKCLIIISLLCSRAYHSDAKSRKLYVEDIFRSYHSKGFKCRFFTILICFLKFPVKIAHLLLSIPIKSSKLFGSTFSGAMTLGIKTMYIMTLGILNLNVTFIISGNQNNDTQSNGIRPKKTCDTI